MSGETYVCISGRLTRDVELRFSQNGNAVANFSVAVNARKFDKNTNEWVEKPAKFWNCTAWNAGKLTMAENIADGLKKGDAVVVYGEIETRKYTTKEGEERVVDDIRVEGVGKDYRFHGTRQNTVPAAPAQAHGNVWGAPQQNNGGGSGGWDLGTPGF